VPQIEVAFDIDANGIVHVSAKDLGTGREQSIQITASSGLTEQEIQRMVRDAEEHAAEDHKRREVAEARNHADNLLYSTERTLKELGDKVDPATRADVEAKMNDLKRVMEGGELEPLKRATDELIRASHKLAEQMYARTTQAGAGPQPGEGAQPGAEQKKPEDVVEAEFEEK